MSRDLEELERIERIADLLDSRFTIPGTTVRFGLDSLMGLIPGLGDAAGLFASLYVMQRLSELGLPKTTRTRMALNIALDTAAGVVPLVGDVVDLAFRANRKNIELARRALEKQGRIPMTIDVAPRRAPFKRVR
jgi:hypothetical protein